MQVPADLTIAQAFFLFNEHPDDANSLQAAYASSSVGDWKTRANMILIDPSTLIHDLVSMFKFRRIEFVISAPEAAPAPVPRNAFDELMNVRMDYLPPISEDPATGNLHVRDDILSYLRNEHAFFRRDERPLAKSVVDALEMVLWNLDGQATKFAQASNVPALPDSLTFRSHRVISHVQGSKKSIPIDERSHMFLILLLIDIESLYTRRCSDLV